MTVYRCVCPYCTAYIRSTDDSFCYRDHKQFWEKWSVECNDFLSRHVCGLDSGDGIENYREFERYEQDH